MLLFSMSLSPGSTDARRQPTALSRIRIVLVEPEGPINVGSVARVMKNFGMQNLALVRPKMSLEDDSVLKFASHARDIVQNAQVFDSTLDALRGTRFVAATTARDRDGKAARLLRQVFAKEGTDMLLNSTSDSALLFGAESRGLSNEDLNYANVVFRIPANPEYPVLNLSHSVGVICYELFCASEVQDLPRPESAREQVAQVAEREGLLKQLFKVLEASEYFRSESATADKMANFQWMINRLQLTSTDVSLIRGVLRRIERSLGLASDEHR